MEVTALVRSVRKRPSSARGLLAVLLAGFVATWLVSLFPRPRTLRYRLRPGRKRVEAAVALFPLALRLLSNPIVRGYVRGTVARRISQKLRR